ncbi:MAG: murein tripeptide amidase MpaA [Candidatus Marinimicrobia bacterium]|nr:murein tripeptide amidase MpaA [Candidatus Neomarinimicrobiota bacterium]
MTVARTERGKLNHQLHKYGTTQFGSPLNVILPLQSEVNILLMSGIHGDEPETTVLLSEALRSVTCTELKNAAILCANPDGMQRGTRANASGVDLNRNFPAANWSAEPVYHRNILGEPQDIELSTGAEPASELETQALIKLIQKIKPSYVIAFHGALACVDDPGNTVLGKWLAKQAKIDHLPDVGYPTPGSFGTWAADNGIRVVTFELPPKPLTEMKISLVPMIIDLLTDSWINQVTTK